MLTDLKWMLSALVEGMERFCRHGRGRTRRLSAYALWMREHDDGTSQDEQPLHYV